MGTSEEEQVDSGKGQQQWQGTGGWQLSSEPSVQGVLMLVYRSLGNLVWGL